jgi:hypothetical protein
MPSGRVKQIVNMALIPLKKCLCKENYLFNPYPANAKNRVSS